MADTVLKMTGITKRFPGVLALDHADLELKKGEVHILLGENGAGKSTLIKVLSGTYQKDEGTIEYKGEIIENTSPKRMKDIGISTIYQEFNLVPMLSVADNIFLGKEITKNNSKETLDKKEMYEQAQKIINELHISIDIREKVSNLSVAQQQMVEISRALYGGANIIIMDEPTAALTDNEIDTLFDMIKKLTAQGTSIIYISHRLEEFERIGDRITVMRDGQTIKTLKVHDEDTHGLIKLMVGREIQDIYPDIEFHQGKALMRVSHLTNKNIADVSFSVHEGEILGVAGLMGSGRTELAKAIFGLDAVNSGDVEICGVKVDIKSPEDAIRNGIALLPENRKEQGLIMVMNVMENITINNLGQFINKGKISAKKELAVANDYIEKLRIRTPGPYQKAMNLSGGNQQKIVVAKWLLSQSKIIIFDEPTRGIDVGARSEIYTLIKALVDKGAAVIMISSDLPEILGLSENILVMAQGHASVILPRSEATQEKILYYATMGGN